ncbi:hypothetical protein AAHB47_29780 [Bacillus wiedmannii]
MYSKAMGKEAVVSINNERVQKEEVIENLKRQYWDISLNNTINMKLLNLAVEEHKIDLSQKDLDNFKKNSSFLKQSDLIKMSKDEQAKYLKEMYILNIVAKRKHYPKVLHLELSFILLLQLTRKFPIKLIQLDI